MLSILAFYILSLSPFVSGAAATDPRSGSLWFQLGHRVIAEIAAGRLTPTAAAAVRDLLSGQDIGDASLWADQIRGERRSTGSLHFVNIPLEATAYDPGRDCPGGRCIIAAIDSFVRILGDSSTPRGERAEALRFVLHLVGDIHQPLHAANNGDKGGNDTQVRLEGAGTNLHAAWDGKLIETTGLDERGYLARLR